ncbi:MAG: hypothetical protein AB1679_24575 [Actinomycetota bacterium]
MKRRLVTLALITTAAAGIPSPGFTSETTGGGCTEPVPERIYSADRLAYRLSVDLSHCDWWDGSPIQLDAGLERLDGTGGHGAWSGTVCGIGLAMGTDSSEPEAETTVRSKSGVCEIQVAMEHPPVEAAYYRGEVSFPWQGARRTLAFTALCGQPGGCADLPVDPMPSLAPIGELIVGDDAF